jgi:hypothetical protein
MDALDISCRIYEFPGTYPNHIASHRWKLHGSRFGFNKRKWSSSLDIPLTHYWAEIEQRRHVMGQNNFLKIIMAKIKWTTLIESMFLVTVDIMQRSHGII